MAAMRGYGVMVRLHPSPCAACWGDTSGSRRSNHPRPPGPGKLILSRPSPLTTDHHQSAQAQKRHARRFRHRLIVNQMHPPLDFDAVREP